MSEFDETVQQAHIWIKAVHQRTGWEDEHRSWRLLRATLQALRDHLPLTEVADLGAQLPLLLRGVYYEGWRPTRLAVEDRSKEGFIGEVQQAFRTDPMGDAEHAVRAVFALLSEKISGGEIEDVKRALPKHIRELFPE
jgi:uncharacterized protein (DUF2267 family)